MDYIHNVEDAKSGDLTDGKYNQPTDGSFHFPYNSAAHIPILPIYADKSLNVFFEELDHKL